MTTLIMFILATIGLLLLRAEDRRRRRHNSAAAAAFLFKLRPVENREPVWSRLVFKLWVGGLSLVLVLVFLVENGAWFTGLLANWHVATGVNAEIFAVIATLWAAMVYGTIMYLLIIPDDDKDLSMIADAVYYDGSRRFYPGNH